MDGRGRWMDNVFIERLWRSLKHEEIYLHEHTTVRALEQGVTRWIEHYNTWRPHAALDDQTPQQLYRPARPTKSEKNQHRQQAA